MLPLTLAGWRRSWRHVSQVGRSVALTVAGRRPNFGGSAVQLWWVDGRTLASQQRNFGGSAAQLWRVGGATLAGRRAKFGGGGGEIWGGGGGKFGRLGVRFCWAAGVSLRGWPG